MNRMVLLVISLVMMAIPVFASGIGYSGGGGGSPGGSNGQLQYNNSGNFGGVPAVNGDGTLNTTTGALLVTKTNGSAFAASATTDTTNASNISSGTLGAGRLPNPSASTLGGIESLVATSHQWINTISTSGVPSSTQPAFSDISGNISTNQMNSGTGASSSTFWRGDSTWATPTASITNQSSVLGSDVALNVSGTYFDGPTTTIGVGTWLVTAQTLVILPGSTSATYKLWDGTTVFASGEANDTQRQTTLTAIVTVASGTKTMKCSVANNGTTGNIKASCTNNGAPASATQINAVKLQ